MLTHRVGTAAGGGLPGPPAPAFPCLAVIGSWLVCPGHNSELPDGIGDKPQALLHPQEGLPEGLIQHKAFWGLDEPLRCCWPAGSLQSSRAKRSAAQPPLQQNHSALSPAPAVWLLPSLRPPHFSPISVELCVNSLCASPIGVHVSAQPSPIAREASFSTAMLFSPLSGTPCPCCSLPCPSVRAALHPAVGRMQCERAQGALCPARRSQQ